MGGTRTTTARSPRGLSAKPLALDLPLHDERRYGDTLIRFYGP